MIKNKKIGSNKNKTGRNDRMAEALRKSVGNITMVSEQIEEEKRLGVYESKRKQRIAGLF